jgi:hypothetical protein
MKSDENRPESYLTEAFFTSDLPDTCKTDSVSKPRMESPPITPIITNGNDPNEITNRSTVIERPPMK